MSNTALGVAQTSAGIGTTDTAMRHILAAQWESTGVVSGLAVKGGTTLAYTVAAGVAVCSKGASDGKTLAWFEGGSTTTVAANSSGNPRIDCVWITSHDLTQGDSDNLVTLGVTQGTPAATPTAPTIPTYATLLAQMRMPAGATTTANATQAASIGYAIPYGASLGVLHSYVSTYDGIVGAGPVLEDVGRIYLPTDRLLEFRYTRCASDSAGTSSLFYEFQLDGTAFVQTEVALNARWQTYEFSAVKTVTTGNHTVGVRNGPRVNSGSIYYHYAADSSHGTSPFTGMTFQIIDRGVVL